jgi:hypothetical protein
MVMKKLIYAALLIGLPSLAFAQQDVNTKKVLGPITGFEGHNFAESPAILYPNPVKEELNIKSTDPITVIEILNVHGQVEKLWYPSNQMLVDDLPAGTYYARIYYTNKKSVQIEKIMVTK